MANVDAGFGMQPRERPRAVLEAYRPPASEEQPAQRRAAPSLPKFSRLDAGQLIRTLILVALCFGAIQLSHAEKGGVDGDGAAIAAPAKRM